MTFLFVFELTGGLANRLRALWSAHAFALRYRRLVVVLWPLTSELACEYQQLFHINGRVCVICVTPADPFTGISLRLARFILSSFRFGLNCPIEAGEAWGKPLRFAPRWMPSQWIQTCASFEDFTDILPPFSPAPQLHHEASLRVAALRETGFPLIGVHVRRRDHRLSTRHSPTSAYIKAMTDCLRFKPRAYFLLCTDDRTEESCLRSVFGNRLIHYPPASLDRSSKQAGIDAMIDFLMLSSCDLILGSAFSSFSLLAARYGGIPHHSIHI